MLNALLGAIGDSWPLLLGVFLVWLIVRHGKAVSAALKVNGFAVALCLIIIEVAIILVFKPTVLSFAFGIGRQEKQARADVVTYSLDPSDNPDVWSSKPAQAAARAVQSEYELTAARNFAGVSAAEAERLCHLPQGHPDRVLWDQAKLDPCKASLPAVVQLTQEKLDQPLQANPTKETPNWAKPFLAQQAGLYIFLAVFMIAFVWILARR